MWVETPSSGQNISLLLYRKFNKNFWLLYALLGWMKIQ